MKQIICLFIFVATTFGGPLDSPPIDPRINGTQDDGSAEGVVKTKLTRGQLVKMPFFSGRFATDNSSGSATANYFPAAGQGNPDGSGSTIVVTAPNNSGIRILQSFYGSVFGLRWIRGTSDFGVVIDGVAYRVTSKLSEPESITALAATAEYENLTVIADDLPDGPHVAELIFANATGSQITWQLWGYVVEQRVGHGGDYRVAGVINASTVPTTDTAILDGTTLHSIRKVFYYNTDTVTRTVTIKQNSKVIATLVLTTLTGGSFDLGEFTALAQTASGTGMFSHSTDATFVVNFLPTGGL